MSDVYVIIGSLIGARKPEQPESIFMTGIVEKITNNSIRIKWLVLDNPALFWGNKVTIYSRFYFRQYFKVLSL